MFLIASLITLVLNSFLSAVVITECTLYLICLGASGSRSSKEAASSPVCLSKTVKELVLQHPVFTRIFERCLSQSEANFVIFAEFFCINILTLFLHGCFVNVGSVYQSQKFNYKESCIFWSVVGQAESWSVFLISEHETCRWSSKCEWLGAFPGIKNINH